MADSKKNETLYETSLSDLKVLVKTRLALEDEFNDGRKKKSVIWNKVLVEIKKQIPTFPMTRDEIIRKFLNLSVTYKRIKQRNIFSDRTKTSWEFYDEFDEVYGTRYSIIQKNETKQSKSASETEEEELNVEPKQTKCIKCKKRKNEASEFLLFLKEQSEREQIRHDELMEMERKKLRLEERRMQVFDDLKDILRSSFKTKRL